MNFRSVGLCVAVSLFLLSSLHPACSQRDCCSLASYTQRISQRDCCSLASYTQRAVSETIVPRQSYNPRAASMLPVIYDRQAAGMATFFVVTVTTVHQSQNGAF